jgi:ubiquinone/menaquinone biosynthesis C-methylase UbiE
MKNIILGFLLSSISYGVYDVALKPSANPSFDQKNHAKKINEKFVNQPDANEWDGKFSDANRDVYVHREKIIEQMNIQESDHVVDLGAGTGVFIPEFLKKVNSGKVYALEISDSFINFLNNKNETDWGGRVQVVKNTVDSTNLIDASIDIIFLCDVFHHFEDINVMLSEFKRVLKRPGRVVVVDFDRKGEKAHPFILGHQPFSKDTHIKFFEDAGFEFTGEKDAELTDNFMLEFKIIQ